MKHNLDISINKLKSMPIPPAFFKQLYLRFKFPCFGITIPSFQTLFTLMIKMQIAILIYHPTLSLHCLELIQ